MDCCCKEQKPIRIYKGFPTAFAGKSLLTLIVNSDVDLTGFKAYFSIGNIVKQYDDITQPVPVNLTAEETGSLPLGLQYATLEVEDGGTNKRPFTTAIPIINVEFVEGDIELDGFSMEVNTEIQENVLNIRIETNALPRFDHNELVNRNLPDQHPIEAITGLREELESGFASLQAEQQARIDSDLVLGQRIEEEASNRASADTTLQNNINSEKNNRITNDNALGTRIDDEITARQQADTTLGGRIDSEAQAREQSDTQLQNNIDQLSEDLSTAIEEEAETRASEDSSLGTRIDDEISARQTDVNNLNTALQTETTNRENADGVLEQSIRDEETRATTEEGNLNTLIEAEESERISADEALQLAIDTINGKIPAQATSSNQLADKEFVNSSIATNTANFIGTFDSLEELEAYTGTKTNNDYAFVIGQDSEGNTEYKRYKWTTAETPNSWKYEFTLNNSSFTAEQWAAISSKITSSKVEAYDEHISDTDIHVTTTDKANWNGKQGAISDLGTIRSNAQAGKNAKDTIDTYGDVVTHNASEFYQSTNPNGYQTAQQVNTAISNHNQDEESHSDIRADVDELDKKIDEILVQRVPDAIIVGNPTIQNGQVSGFSSSDYLILPFLFDVKERAFELTYCFKTGNDVTTPQNLFGSNYCIASYISNGKLTVRVSGNGTSWNVVSLETSLTVLPNSIYYIKIIFNRLNYTIKASTDGVEYTQIGYVVDTTKPFAGQVYIGVGNNQNNPFLGILHLSRWELKYNNSIFWEGLDDAGLATRADISLSNLDADGEARFTAKLDAPTTGTEGQYLQKTADGVQWNTLDALQNTATGNNSLTILGTPTTKNESVNIGKNSNLNNGGNRNVAIGYTSVVQTGADYATAMGWYAWAQHYGSIALGAGCRTGKLNSFYVAVGGFNAISYMMMDSNGHVPVERLGGNSTATTSNKFLREDGNWDSVVSTTITYWE